MKKTTIMKKGTAFTLAAMMALTVYAPSAAFAGETPEEQTPAQTEVTKEVEVTEAPAPQASEEAAPAPQASEEAAPAQEAAAPQESETPAATEEAAPAVEEESAYGEATGNWGYGNSTQTTRWDEYTKDGETILVFKTTGESDSDEDNAVTQLLDENGKNMKSELQKRVTQVVFETGITGIGWTALYDRGAYEPVYSSEYEVDRTRTDLFKDFTKLTVVTPCETIKRIGWSAFRKCYNLRGFDFSKCTQLEEIMNQAFNECKSLNTVDLSNCSALETIAWSAFNGAGKGSEADLTLPAEGVLSVIGGYAFYKFAEKNAADDDVDFAPVAGSVTKILRSAFEGSHIAGEIIGFKNLEGLGNNAIKNSKITYVEYDPSQDIEEPAVEEEVVEEPVVEEPIVEEPVVEKEELVVQEEETVVEEEPTVEEEVAAEEAVEEEPTVEEEVAVEEPIAEEEEAVVQAEEQIVQDELMNIAEVVESPVIRSIETMAVQSEAVPSANGPAVQASASNRSAAKGATGSVISESAAPAAAPAAQISDNDMPMAAADNAADSSLGQVLGGMAAALLMALAAVAAIRRKNTIEE